MGSYYLKVVTHINRLQHRSPKSNFCHHYWGKPLFYILISLYFIKIYVEIKQINSIFIFVRINPIAQNRSPQTVLDSCMFVLNNFNKISIRYVQWNPRLLTTLFTKVMLIAWMWIISVYKIPRIESDTWQFMVRMSQSEPLRWTVHFYASPSNFYWPLTICSMVGEFEFSNLKVIIELTRHKI